MDPLVLVIIAMVAAGAVVMLISILDTKQILLLLNQKVYVRSWRVLRLLMISFLLGYLAVAGLLLDGIKDSVPLIMGLVFLFGAVFVYLVVRVGFLTVNDLMSQAARTDQTVQELQHSQHELQEIEASARPILESVKMGILIIDTETSQIIDANPAAANMIGATKNKIVGQECHRFVCLAECGKCPILDLGQTVDNSERVLLKANGEKLPIVKTVVAAVIGGRKCLIESFFDITHQKEGEQALKQANEQLALELFERARVEKALRESDERFALAVRGANDGLWDWDLKTDRVYYSPRWKSMLGCAENKIGDSPREWLDRVHPDDLAKLQADLASHISGSSAHFESEYRIRHCDGTYLWMLCRGLAIWNGADKPLRMAGSQSDITRRKIAEEKLAHDALHDPLTGLPNRVLFMDRLEHALKRARRSESARSAVLFLDLDRFKWINDSLGHQAGDKLLAAIGHRLESCIRPGDTIARFGGDEFAILLDDVQEDVDSTRLAERVHGAFQKPFTLDGHAITVSASIGIALCAGESSTAQMRKPEEILRDADTAMYRAKALGRARYEVFDNSMHTHAVAVLHLEEGLRRAVEREEFRLYYQPIVSLKTGKVTTVEALLRWEHPERGLVQPGEFIPAAEETGLIVPIGEWVLRTACTQAQAWHAAGYPQLELAVNCSARQFQDGNLAATIRRVLNETGMPADLLQIEITESTAMNDAASIRALHELRAMGVQISLDDFGDGYSALGNLKHLPLNILKIDQSLMRGIVLDPGNAAITIAIIAMARNLNLRAIAEGVETEEEREFLAARQCDEVQGFLFSRPVPAEQITGLLNTDHPIPLPIAAC